MLAGIRDVIVITTPVDASPFGRLLGDGRQFGISISYAVQPSPDGLAQAFVIGRDHIGAGPVALVLGGAGTATAALLWWISPRAAARPHPQPAASRPARVPSGRALSWTPGVAAVSPAG